MPNCVMPWNPVSGQGNPTRSIEVNTLIKKVKKKEVRKQGVASKARRAITHVEFRRMQSILREKNDVSPLWYSKLTDEVNDDEASGAVAQGSTLGPNPQTLYLLWDEYENGIGE
jgi:hypothetical protein